MSVLDHLPVLVVVLPALTAVALLFIGDGSAGEHGGHGHDHAHSLLNSLLLSRLRKALKITSML